MLSRLENRCVLTYLWHMSHSKDLILLLVVFVNGPQKPHSLSEDKDKMGYNTSTCKRAEQVFPLSNLGAQISHWTFPASPDISSSIQTTDPPG
jgi:hypothetical protein